MISTISHYSICAFNAVLPKGPRDHALQPCHLDKDISLVSMNLLMVLSGVDKIRLRNFILNFLNKKYFTVFHLYG